MLCDFQRSTEKVGLNIHPEKTNILSNQSSKKRKEVVISNIKVEVLLVHECAKYLKETTTFQQQETTEIRSRIRAAWASFCRYKQELTSRSYPLQHLSRLFSMVIFPTLGYACGTWTLTKEHERMIRSTQRKMLRLIEQTRRKYKTSNLKIKKVTLKKKDSQENSEDDTQEGSSTDTDCDQDSDVSLAKDSDKESDTAELEQEDWIENIKEAQLWQKKNEYSQDSMLDRNAQENEVAIGDENSIATKRTMGKKSSRMESRFQQPNQNEQSCSKTKKIDGKMKSTNSSIRKRQKQQKAAISKITTLRSRQRKKKDKWKEKEEEFTTAYKKKKEERS